MFENMQETKTKWLLQAAQSKLVARRVGSQLLEGAPLSSKSSQRQLDRHAQKIPLPSLPWVDPLVLLRPKRQTLVAPMCGRPIPVAGPVQRISNARGIALQRS